jgi:hypothetical protein
MQRSLQSRLRAFKTPARAVHFSYRRAARRESGGNFAAVRVRRAQAPARFSFRTC